MEYFLPLAGFLGAALAVIGTVIAVPAALPGLIDLWAKIGNRLHVRQITHAGDADLVGLDELQSATFTSDVADEIGEVRRYVSESSSGPADRSMTQPYFLAFVLKFRGIVCGYLTAEFFPHSQTIFLWYLLVDKTKVPQHTLQQRGSLMLLEAMAKGADRTGVPWEHIITEVEAAPSDLLSARAKMLVFKNAAEELSRRAQRTPVRVFRLPIQYRQPILHVELLDDAAEHEVPEWLLYAPRDIAGHVVETDHGVTMSRALATTLLDTLLIKGYARAFAHSPPYGDYCRKMLSEYVETLPELLLLHENPRAVTGTADVPRLTRPGGALKT